MTKDVVLSLSCRDRPGIVALVAGFLADRGFMIRDSQQFGDLETELFFMRIHAGNDDPVDFVGIRRQFGEVVGDVLKADWTIEDPAHRQRTLVMVSRQGHCLNDLLHRVRMRSMPTEIVAVVSNHEDFRTLVEWHGIEFHHVPVTRETKEQAEDDLRRLLTAYDVELVVLARYMQILSDPLCRELAGRAINIHHSLLPSFKGARPYFQAHARGVKVIGATAHYVTADLDEGPIIEQDFTRVDHLHSAADLTEMGRDLEALALARAVTAHAEYRVLMNGSRTVVFR